MKLTIYSFFTLLFSSIIHSQSAIDSVLNDIEKNNKTIVSALKLLEAKKLEYQTGLTLENPFVEYDYLIGTPSNAGNQTDFTIAQAFDFPTSYAKKKQVTNEKIIKANNQIKLVRQEVLLEAKQICIELIYRNKLLLEIQKRLKNVETWVNNFQKKLDKGDGNIMDVNKAKLKLVEVKTAYLEQESKIEQLNQKLIELNGGAAIKFNDTLYPFKFTNLILKELEREIEQADITKKSILQEKAIAEKEVELSKSLALPKLTAGYHYQAILGQTFNGIHLGFSIPLWENKNKVKAKKSEALFYSAKLEEHTNSHLNEIKTLYNKQNNLQVILKEYKKQFSSLNDYKLLNKSLSLGQITILEYFTELDYYYKAYDYYLKTELEFNKIINKLNKHKL